MTNKKLIETLRITGELDKVNKVYYETFLKELGESEDNEIEICETFKKFKQLGVSTYLNLEVHSVLIKHYSVHYVDAFKKDFNDLVKWVSAIKNFCIEKDIDVYLNMFLGNYCRERRRSVRETLDEMRVMRDIKLIKVEDKLYDIDNCVIGIGEHRLVLTEHDDRVGNVDEDNIVNYLLIKDNKLIKGYTKNIREDDYELAIVV